MSTSSAPDTPANHSPSLVPGKENTTPGISGLMSPVPFAFYDHDGCCWRTSQGTFPWASDKFSAIWPRAGTTRNGIASQRQPSAPLTDVTGFTLLPTQTVNDSKNDGSPSQMRRNSLALNSLVKLWPTPTARLGTQRGAQAKRYHNPDRSYDLDDAVAASGQTGQLNPTWVEWLMGFPTGWTDLEHSETPSSPKSHNTSDN